MKKIAMLISLLTLILALFAATAFAEPSDTLKGIYDALLKEGSSYSELKATYAEYFPETECTESLSDNGFTLLISGNEYSNGTWTFTEEDGYLTTTLANDDYTGLTMVLYVVNAVGDYYGEDAAVFSGYVNGLTTLGIDSDNFSMTFDEDADASTVCINISGAWDMKELDQMVLDENALYSDALDEDYVSTTANIGKVRMVANGNVDDVTILLGEYGALDDVAYQSIINVVSLLKPNGWEDFVANYTELTDAEADGYTVALNVDDAAVNEIIETETEGFSFALIHFGA